MIKICSSLVIGIIVFSFSVKSFAFSCVPTCSSTDARLLSIPAGTGTATITSGFVDVRIIVPGHLTSFSLEIFDGNAEEAIETTWDLAIEDNLEYSYTVHADPDRDNTGPVAFQIFASNLSDNAWDNFMITTNENARDANGDFIYNLRVQLISPAVDASFNGFKARSMTDGVKLRLEGVFGIIAAGYSPAEFLIIYPNAPDLTPTTYDGTFTLSFDVEGGPLAQLDIWDADFDYGDEMGVDQDTDDPNTPNTVPAFQPPGQNAIPEGANCCDPFDTRNDPTFARDPNVIYTVITPDGVHLVNENASGNREWELFSITTLPGPVNTSLYDLRTDSLPEGRYTILIEGMDITNHNTFRAPFPIIGEESISESVRNVPTLSEWSYIALALFFGIIGVWYIRRKAYTN